MKTGDTVTFQHYGETRRGEVLTMLTTGLVYVLRLDGPLAGRMMWLHKESVTVGDG